MKRSLRTIPGRYLTWATLAAAVGLIAFLIAATMWFGIVGAAIVIGLALVAFIQVLFAWEAGKFPFASKLPSTRRTIPYYRPSRQAYTQGYQAQTTSIATYQTPIGSQMKNEPPGNYEQPSAQYPEQMPPMA